MNWGGTDLWVCLITRAGRGLWETLTEFFQSAGSWVPGGAVMCTWILELQEVVA